MPNLKLYVGPDANEQALASLQDNALALRDMICSSLNAPTSAFQIACMPVMGIADQPAINAELTILKNAERTQERLGRFVVDLRRTIETISGLPAAVRITVADPVAYITSK